MKIATVREFRDRATQLLKEDQPLLITRRGKIAGLYLPLEAEQLPVELKTELQQAIARLIRTQLEKKRIHEEAILADFEKHRTARR